MSIVTDFKSIKRKLNRMEQKATFDAENPEPEFGMYGWPYGVAVPYAPYVTDEQVEKLTDWLKTKI